MVVVDIVETQNTETSGALNGPKKSSLKSKEDKQLFENPRAAQEDASVVICLPEKDWDVFENALISRRATPKLNQAFKKLKKQCN